MVLARGHCENWLACCELGFKHARQRLSFGVSGFLDC